MKQTGTTAVIPRAGTRSSAETAPPQRAALADFRSFTRKSGRWSCIPRSIFGRGATALAGCAG